MKESEPDRVIFSIRMPAAIDKKLKDGARKIGITKAAYIMTLIDKALESESQKPPSESV